MKLPLEKTLENGEKQQGYGWGVRHVQTLLMFLGVTLAYSFRVDISVAIEAMLDNKQNPNFKAYHWPSPIPEVIKSSSFFVGYVIMQVPASQIIIKYGFKYPLGIALTICSLVCLLIPIAADVHWTAVAGCRVIQGLSQGFVYPSIHQMVSSWVPTEERGRLPTYIFAGGQFGTVLAMPISGWLSASPTFGWVSVFYLNGAVGLLWALAWFRYASSTPDTSTRITHSEKDYIQQSIGEVKHETYPVPWKRIFKSLPFWAILITHCANNWGFWTLLTDIPSYMKNIFGMDLAANGVNSAIPYFSMWIFSFFLSGICDTLINRNVLSTVAARKTFQCIGHIIPALALIGLGYCTKDTSWLAMILLIVAVSFNAGTYCGFLVNHVDIAPNFASTLMGLTNGAANIISVIAPMICGLIANDETKTDPHSWRIVFFISAAVFIGGTSVFLLFGTADVQDWNEPEPKTVNEKKKSVASIT